MKKINRFGWVSPFLVLAMAMMACIFPMNNQERTPAGANPTPGEGLTPGGTPALKGAPVNGMVVGLDHLDSYKATLKVAFKGTSLGTPQDWTKTYQLVVSKTYAARLLSISTTGDTLGQTLDGWVMGLVNGIAYTRFGKQAPCAALTSDSLSAQDVLEPAALTPMANLTGLAGKADDQNGVATSHYTLNEKAIGLQDPGKARGDIWLARQGGYVVSYQIQATGDQGLNDPDLIGTMTWDYTLIPGEPQAELPLPLECPPSLGANPPKMQDASVVLEVPGYLEYTTASGIKDVVAFYQAELPKLGYTPTGDVTVSDFSGYWEMTNAGKTLIVMVRGGSPVTVSLSLQSGQPQAIDIPVPSMEPTAAANLDAYKRISSALGLVMGRKDQPGVYPSYHLDVKQSRPVLDQNNKKIGQEEADISVDVSGSDIHATFNNTPVGGSPTVIEGYLVGGQNYLVKNGKAQKDALGNPNTLDILAIGLIQPLTIASLASTTLPGETIEGRPADVFAVDTAKANPTTLDAIKNALPLNPHINTAKGQVWLDQQTGGLLKAVLDYEGVFLDTDGTTSLGTGTGHIEITITQIGAVTVALP